MTFADYIKNPMGAKTSVMTNRQVYKDMYTEKWNTLMVRENGLYEYKLYADEKDGSYYVHVKIPSEVVPKFYYDTIARFYLSKDGVGTASDNNLLHYDVQFYSNDPSFVYTFAHAFRKHDMLIKDLEYKMSKLALTQKPKEKNPNDETGYVKSIYFLYLAMTDLKLFNKSAFGIRASKYNKKVWDNTVTHADDKVRDRQEQGAALEKKNKRESNEKKNENNGKSTKSPTHKFTSPNVKDFGHFKRTFINPFGKAAAKLNQNIGKFKKTVGK